MYSNLFTIGNTPELRYTQGGKAVVSLSLACDAGYGDNKRTTWISAALWEKRAESLLPYLDKGQQVFCVLDDIELDKYQKQDGTHDAKIKARVVDIKLVRGEKKPQQQEPPASRQQGGGFDDFGEESDIPF